MAASAGLAGTAVVPFGPSQASTNQHAADTAVPIPPAVAVPCCRFHFGRDSCMFDLKHGLQVGAVPWWSVFVSCMLLLLALASTTLPLYSLVVQLHPHHKLKGLDRYNRYMVDWHGERAADRHYRHHPRHAAAGRWRGEGAWCRCRGVLGAASHDREGQEGWQ
jgi:hypothetical protein